MDRFKIGDACRLLAIAWIADLVLWGLTSLLNLWVSTHFGEIDLDAHETFWKSIGPVTNVADIVLSVIAIVAIARLGKAHPERAGRRLAEVALIAFIIVALVSTGLMAWALFAGDLGIDSLYYKVSARTWMVSLPASIVASVAIVESLTGLGRSVGFREQAVRIGFYAAVFVVVLRSLWTFVPGSFDVLSDRPVLEWAVRAVPTLALLGLRLAYLRQVTGAVQSAKLDDPAPSEEPTAARVSPTLDLVVGACFAGGGLLVTVLSFSAPIGGRAVVAWGAIAYGVIRLIRGISRSRAS